MARTGLVKVLGCGGSGGVPLATGFWGNCDPANPKNRRSRACIAVQVDGATLIVDTGTDFRTQTITHGITQVSSVLYTHAHSDHTNGIDELRYVSILTGRNVPIWADEGTLQELQARFAHLFMASPDGIYKPVLEPHVYASDQFGRVVEVDGVPFIPFWQGHGTSGRSLGYRFGNFAYSTDASKLDEAAFTALEGVETWLVDCAQFGNDFTIVHANFDVVRGWNERVRARRVILTHLPPRVDYEACRAALPPGYEPAFDGMEIEISIGT